MKSKHNPHQITTLNSPSFKRDLDLILAALNEQDVFVDHGSREVAGYSKNHGLLEKYNYANIQEWLM